MSWVLWRQHRSHVAVLGAIVATAAVLLSISHHSLGTRPYRAAPLHLDNIDRILVNLAIGLPLLLGVFLGAPVVAREAEQGTQVLLWTQTITRRRWLAWKLTSVMAVTVVWAAAVTVLVTWWSHRWFNGGTRFEPIQFDTQNLVPIAYSVFAVALAFAAGATLRRMLPSVGVTVGAFLVTRVMVEVFARPHLAPAVVLHGDVPKGQDLGWILSRTVFNQGGAVVRGRLPIPDQCVAVGPGDLGACVQRAGYRIVTILQPNSHYWRIQATEAAIFTALAAALVAAGVVLTLRRDA